MSESERRHGYAYNRILIETERVLDPQFSDAVVFLSGAQIEMLRNITQYLNRQETYVTEYMPGYYIAPTIADYDDILEIVADLEETLMGNPNVIWGYNDNYAEWLLDLDAPAGMYDLDGETVPEGEVWRVTGGSAITFSTSCTDIRYYAYLQTKSLILVNQRLPEAGVVYPFAVDAILKEGDRVYMRFYNLTEDDNVYACLWGYKMVVPVP